MPQAAVEQEALALPTRQTHRFLIDYDSTLADTNKHRIDWINKRFGTSYVTEGITHWHNHDSNYLLPEHDDWQWGPECFMNLAFQISVPPVPHAIEGMEFLLDQGHRPLIVSDRPIQLYDVTRHWLDNNGLDMVRLLFTRHKASLSTVTEGMQTKLQTTWSHRLTHVVEDAPHHAVALSLKSYVERVYLLDKPYNKLAIHEKIIRVPDWRGVTTHLIKGE